MRDFKTQLLRWTLLVASSTISRAQDVDGGWTDWEDASLCCNGKKDIVRTCTNPSVSGNGAPCAGPDTFTETCSPDAIGCVLHVDGGWTDWKAETICCNGQQSLSRTCTNPAPKGNGAQCAGPDFIVSTCSPDSSECIPDVDGGWTEWEAETICCNGYQKVSRTCTNPSPSGNGADCEGPGTIATTCSPDSSECIPDIDGGWSDWTEDTICCNGEQMVSRTCTNPSPSGNGATCEGAALQIQACGPDECIPDVDGGWTDWTTDTICCNGEQTVSRTCTNPSPSGNGASCEGAASETRSCGPDECIPDMDGGWTDWNTDTFCCNGEQTLSRTCTNPSPSGNGASCEGAASETRSCGPDECIPDVDGGWTDWTEDTICCNGEQTVSRTCTNPSPSGNGASCEGAPSETRACGPDECIPDIDGGWTDWTKDTICCDGEQTMSRTCTNPSPSGNGAPCEGDASESRSCGPDECIPDIDGGWTDWEVATICCDGKQTISRTCTNPSPSGSGASCKGDSTKTQKCGPDECIPDMDGGWTDWTIDTICCNGEQTVSRTCTNPSPSGDGAPCEGAASETRSCGPDECIPDIDGGWTDWTKDTICCNGEQTVSRTCTNPSPSGNGASCEGDASETRSCGPDECIPDIDGGWTDWNTDTICCNGEQTVSRTCTNPSPSGNGASCEGDASETRACGPDECIPDIDGGWSDWEVATICCNGEQTMNRTCTNPIPSGDGAQCEGAMTEVRTCGPDECVPDIDGGWTDWQEDTVCCEGEQMMSRTCTNPEPSGNGVECEGPDTEIRACSPDDCFADVDGGWSQWTPDTICCNGEQNVSRACTKPLPSGNGAPCDGPDSVVASCFPDECVPDIDGGWSEWKNETVCCNGFQTRSRSCSNPLPSGNGAVCVGEARRVDECFVDECDEENSGTAAGNSTNSTYQDKDTAVGTANTDPVSGAKEPSSGWGDWQAVGYCCFGSQPFTRTCENPELGCPGDFREDRTCIELDLCTSSLVDVVDSSAGWMPRISMVFPPVLLLFLVAL